MASVDEARLFLALWPGPAVRARLARAGDWRWAAGTVGVGEPRLHMTLHFLGHMPRHHLKLLAEGLVVNMQPFELMLDRAEVWRNGAAILCPSQFPEELLVLQRSLSGALRHLGLAPEARSFRPHVTLARRAGATVAPQGFAPVRWWVTGYQLMESRLLPAGASYTHVRHYPAAPTPRVRDSRPPVEWPSGPVPLDSQPQDSRPSEWSGEPLLQSRPMPL